MLAESKAIISKEEKKAQLLEQMQKLKDESVAAWEGKKTDDFQYEPERAELKAQMKDWLAEKLGVDDEKKLLIANRKYFATCMAELVYEETVRPNMKDFIH